MTSYEEHPLRDTAAKRCDSLFYDEFLITMLEKCNADSYHKEKNPTGIVNLTTSVNALYEDLLRDRLTQPDILAYETDHQHYFTFHGTEVLREAAASFATDYFKAVEPLQSANFIVTSGVSGGLDMISHVLGDPGDVFLMSNPSYSRVHSDIRDRSEIGIMEIPLSSVPKNGDTQPWQLTPNKVERAIEIGKQRGKRIRAIVLVNPANPTGEVLTKEILVEILQICKRHEIHVVSDEVYGLSAWNQDMNFTSIVAIEELPDPMRTHFLFSFSKDLGLSGFRIGFIHTWNPIVLKALQTLAPFSSIPSSVQYAGAALLNDRDWLNNTLFPDCHSRTRQAYTHASEWMKKLGLPFHPPQGSFFIFADFRRFLPEETREAEYELFKDLLYDHKLCLVPGTELYCPEPGWFRLVFTIPKDTFDEGMKRLQKCLQTRKL